MALRDSSEWKLERISLPDSCQSRGLRWAPNGDLYICCTDHTIHVAPVDGQRRLFAGQTNKSGETNGHRLTEALFQLGNFGFDFLFRESGDILLAESVAHKIRLIRGDMVSTFAGGKNGHKDGPLSDALFDLPCSLVEVHGSIYVVDAENHSVRVISPDGMVGTIVQGSGRRCETGPSFPFYMSVNLDQSALYIAELYIGRIGVLDLETKTMQTFAKADAPRSLHVLPDGSLLVGEYSKGFFHFEAEKILMNKGNMATGTRLPLIDNEKTSPQYASSFDPQTGDLAWSPDSKETIYIYRNLALPNLQWQTVDLTSLLSLSPSHPFFSSYASSSSSPTSSSSSSSQYFNLNLSSGSSFILPQSLIEWTILDGKKHTMTKKKHGSVMNKDEKDKKYEKDGKSSLHDDLCESLKRMENFLQSCDPELAVTFVESLFGGCRFHQLPSSTPKAMIILQLGQLYHEMNLEIHSFETALYNVSLRLTPSNIVLLLSMAWFHQPRCIPLVNVIAEVLKSRDPATWSLEHHFKDEIGKDDFQELSAHLSSPNHSFIHRSLLAPLNLTLPMYKPLCALAEAIQWISSIPTLRDSDTFYLCIEARKDYLALNRFILHSRWPYFSRMFAAGLSECQQGLCELPSSFPPKLLLIIAKFLYTNQVHLQDALEVDTKFYLEEGEVFGLIPAKGEIDHPFRPLYEAFTKIESACHSTPDPPPKKTKNRARPKNPKKSS